MARFVRSDSVVSRRLAGELVLVPLAVPESSTELTVNFYVLNQSGELLWERIASPADAEELAAELVAHFAIDTAAAHADATRFLAELSKIGAITNLPEVL
jgi:hypothetical protein